MIKRLTCILALLTVATVGIASEPAETDEILRQKAPDTVIDPKGHIVIENGFERSNLHQVSLKCGLKPLPPLGCEVGACVCDSRGQNCKWTFICN